MHTVLALLGHRRMMQMLERTVTGSRCRK